MAVDEGMKEEGTDSDLSGEPQERITLQQAGLLAMQTAREVPGNYGQQYAGVQMVFHSVSQEEAADYFFVTLSFQPEGEFPGTPGQEQFAIRKEGSLAYRQLLSMPSVESPPRRSAWLPWAIGIAVVVIVVAVGALFAARMLIGKDGGSPPVIARTGKLTLFLVPSESNPYALSLTGTGLGKTTLVQVPLIYEAVYTDLPKFLWSDFSLVFSGSGFSGAWEPDEKARLVAQLNGRFERINYSDCLALRINGREPTDSCGDRFTTSEYQPGGYRITIDLPAPERLEPTDLVEVSLVLGTSHAEGEEVVPTLVYGGNIPLKTSYLELGYERK